MRNFALTLIVLVIAFFTVFGRNGLFELVQYSAQHKDLQVKLDDLRKKISTEQNTLFGLSESPDYLEKVAREDLGLSKSGEIVYVFDPEKVNLDSKVRPQELANKKQE